MKYSKQIIIALPRAEVFNKLEDPAYLKYWQQGFISFISLGDQRGAVGSRAKLKYKIGHREIVIIETVTKRVFPKKLHVIYESEGVFNSQKSYFEEEPDNSTLWITDNEFKFSGFMRIIGFLKAGSFKKQTQQFMEDFKAFAEEGKRIDKN
ncbi:SRPBCC family protein [Antarcticibacterium sp. 1MA-6-2]|uniref:SRPBCC family protein n=1 Tax=Antarcticibacterium sp. 1MA-6-2 TaxID=2908210 RepID=UPI001F3BCB8E|nr:SRPBCC family protein [Antarcticibacterium sp. 1MA-6-2]UJH91143.1 SRPBCC family protein [Antarcticibacterium sp. 1MA-6-2]